ncbi:MAG: glycoside hydrolase family 113, partial [Phycisphaerae bacterium]
AAVVAHWQRIKHRILTFAARERKPMLFTEIGWDNLDNTLAKPWDYVGTGLVNPHNQFIAYQAFVRVWRTLPAGSFEGAFIWEWLPGCKPTDYGAYSPQGEPVLPLLQHWVSGR